MIEVMVSLLVMTLGLLGVGGLLLTGLNNATASDLASRATQSANEMMDAMRANPTNKSQYVIAWDATIPATPATVAESDIANWLTAVRRIPGGDGQIQLASGATTEYVITIRFSNCLGSLSSAEKTACTGTAGNTASLRTIAFNFGV